MPNARMIARTTLMIAGLTTVLHAPVFAAPPDPDKLSTAPVTPTLAADRDSFEFTNWSGPAIPVWTYVPEGDDRASAPILFVMHGARRDPQRYRDQWIEYAQAAGFVIVAPEFSRADWPRAQGYNLGGVFDDQNGAPKPEELWAFSAIEPIFDDVRARLGSSQDRYTLYGHSAGSQFVHRFLFFKPEARVGRFLAANAGWYTFANPDTPFPFGLGGLPVSEDALRAALAKDVVILLGDQDNDPDHDSLNRSVGAMAQGPHRLARGRAYFTSAQTIARTNGWDFGWQLRIAPGVAHSNGGMAAAAFDLVE